MRRSPGFDPTRTSIFICNHVNIFDPFVIYSAIPQFVRGFELESHFKIPVYGWMMGRFGNIPVPDAPSREGLEIMTQRAKAALDSGISLIAFAEGSRTRDGHVQAIQERDFQSGAEIRSADRAGEHRRLVRIFSDGQLDAVPGKITVYLHDTIETSRFAGADVDALRERVQEIVAAPVEESLKNSGEPQERLSERSLREASVRRAIPARCKPRDESR